MTDGEGNENGLLLFVDDGRLSALVYWWTSDEKPKGFPAAHLIGEAETSVRLGSERRLWALRSRAW